jgi:hypothetical protein
LAVRAVASVLAEMARTTSDNAKRLPLVMVLFLVGLPADPGGC